MSYHSHPCPLCGGRVSSAASRLCRDCHAPRDLEHIALRLAHTSRLTDSGCVEWTGHRMWAGYGRITLSRFRDGGPQRVHRLAYEIAKGPIPAGLVVRHACDNRACINPEHLSLGTPADNTADAVARGRMARGERHGRSRLRRQLERGIA